MSTIEEYALDMVAEGAESLIEDDLNESEDISEEDHPAAVALGLDIVKAIRANPDAILALARLAADETGTDDDDNEPEYDGMHP